MCFYWGSAAVGRGGWLRWKNMSRCNCRIQRLLMEMQWKKVFIGSVYLSSSFHGHWEFLLVLDSTSSPACSCDVDTVKTNETSPNTVVKVSVRRRVRSATDSRPYSFSSDSRLICSAAVCKHFCSSAKKRANFSSCNQTLILLHLNQLFY